MYGFYKVISLKPFKMVATKTNNVYEYLAKVGYATEKELIQLGVFKINRKFRRYV